MSIIYSYLFDSTTFFLEVLRKKYEKISENCHDVGQLYEAILERNNGEKIKSMITCLKMILQMFHTKMILREIEATRIDKNSYCVTYTIGNRQYKMHTTPTTGPSTVMRVTNENGDDITDKVLPYYGPEQNWHGRKFLPSFFDCKALVFESFDGTENKITEIQV
jgi:hypothetical protein